MPEPKTTRHAVVFFVGNRPVEAAFDLTPLARVLLTNWAEARGLGTDDRTVDKQPYDFNQRVGYGMEFQGHPEELRFTSFLLGAGVRDDEMLMGNEERVDLTALVDWD